MIDLTPALRAVVADAVRDAITPVADELARLRQQLEERLPHQAWMTRAEAAKVRNCSLDTLDRDIAAGKIEVRRIGRRGVRVRLPTSPEPDEIARLAAEARGR